MFDLEGFASTHQHTIEFLGVVFTLAAVVVSLVFGYLAYRGRRTTFRAVAYDTIQFEPIETGFRKHRIVTIAITNLGELPISISDDFFNVGLRLSRRSFTIIPRDASLESDETAFKAYPATIEPRKTGRFVISDRDSFVFDCRTLAKAEQPWGKLRLRLLRIRVSTEDGVTRVAKIGEPLLSLILGKQRKRQVMIHQATAESVG